jgi:hypothetical protein
VGEDESGVVVKMRPEAEQRLRAGLQRRVDERRDRYAAQLAHAGQLAGRYEYGEVVGGVQQAGQHRAEAVITGLLPPSALVLAPSAPLV